MEQDTSIKKNSLRVLRWAVTLALLAIVAWFAGDTIRQAWGRLSAAEIRISLGWTLAAGALYLFALTPMSLFWWRTLRSLEQQPRFMEVVRSYYLGHLGKYVPGKAMVVVLRTGALTRAGCDARTTVVSIFLETLTFIATGAALAAALLAITRDAGFSHVLLAVGLAVALGLPIAPPIARRLARWVVQPSDDAISEITWSLAATGVIAALVSWSLLGLSLWATLRAVGDLHVAPFSQLGLWIESTALPMVAGFVSLLPGGIVVRDALVTELLTPTVRPETALLAAALWRIVSVVSEVAICAMLEVTRLLPSSRDKML